MTEQEIRQQFRTMRQLGFRNLKQVMSSPEWSAERLMELALEEGLIPFWYGEAGWEPVTPELAARLEIPPGLAKEQLRADPRMHAYQWDVLRKQIPAIAEAQRSANNNPNGYRHIPDPYLPAEDADLFKAWLRKEYRSPADLAVAWNEDEVGIDDHPFRTWKEVDRAVAAMAAEGRGLRGYGGEYGRVRDVLRFKAGSLAGKIGSAFEKFHALYPLVPTRTGGEMGLFLPFAWHATDMELLAQTQTATGSFYPSIHLAWHYAR